MANLPGSSSDAEVADADDVGQGGDELVNAKDIDTEDAQQPKTLPNVTGPTDHEIELHNATHLPYRSWCRWCVFSRKPNPRHIRSYYSNRDVPLLVGDYCFIRDSRDEELLTLFIGRMYPFKSLVIIPCAQKGADDYAISRLANFIKNVVYNVWSTWLTKNLRCVFYSKVPLNFLDYLVIS